VVPITSASDESVMVAETVAFHDTATGQSGGYHARLDAGSASDETVGVELQEFFRRPVRIGTFTWAESDAVATVRTFNPWALFFTDARVQYKLNNFAFIQCKLKVKVLINSSPFYYGSMYCGYQPLPNFTPSTISTDAGNRHLVLYSQRPCVWLTPQHNEGAEMELPFLYPRNWIDAQSAAAMVDMGQLSFINYTALQSANGVSSAGVSVAIYAWAEDVKLSGPSVGLATQGKSRPLRDEYGVGPVSSVASAVASTAGLLKNVPVIGKFATATQVGASAVSSIAKLFGWTNVPVIEDQKAFKPAPYPPMASTEIGYPIEKLTLDSKNELTVDPSAIGMSPEDELSVVALAQRESYLTTATWSTASTVDTILFTAQATPQLYDVAAQTKQAKVYLTPMAWVATLFTHWRGDIIFRFRIVASPYHKGRLRISFDPAGSSSSSIITDATTSNVVFTQIVDLGEDQDVEVRLPYQQALPYLLNPNLTEQNVQWSTSTTPPFMHAAGADNGTIVMRVQTALTAPVASSSINILVFVRAAENFEVANPRELPLTSPFTTQAKETPVGTGPPSDNETRNLVHFGETVASLRPVLRRFSMVGADHATALGTLYCAIMMKHFTKVPPAYGFDTAGGLQSASGNLTTGPFKFNFCNPTRSRG